MLDHVDERHSSNRSIRDCFSQAQVYLQPLRDTRRHCPCSSQEISRGTKRPHASAPPGIVPWQVKAAGYNFLTGRQSRPSGKIDPSVNYAAPLPGRLPQFSAKVTKNGLVVACPTAGIVCTQNPLIPPLGRPRRTP